MLELMNEIFAKFLNFHIILIVNKFSYTHKYQLPYFPYQLSIYVYIYIYMSIYMNVYIYI